MKHFTPSLFGLFHHQLGSRVQGVSHCRAMSTQASTGQESPPNFEMVSIRPGLDPEAQIYVTYRYNFLGRLLINLCSDILIIILPSVSKHKPHTQVSDLRLLCLQLRFRSLRMKCPSWSRCFTAGQLRWRGFRLRLWHLWRRWYLKNHGSSILSESRFAPPKTMDSP